MPLRTNSISHNSHLNSSTPMLRCYRLNCTVCSTRPQCPPFFLGGETGVILLADDASHCMEMVHLRNPIAAMLFAPAPLSAPAPAASKPSSPASPSARERKVDSPKSPNETKSADKSTPPAPEGHLMVLSQDAVFHKFVLSSSDLKMTQEKKV